MKNFFFLIVILASPLLLFAQQKQSPQQGQQQLQKEMDALRAQMQQQIQSLQDSLSKLQQQLAEEQRGNRKFFEYKTPDNGDYFFSMPDSFDWDHAFNFPVPDGKEFFPRGFVMPEIPEVPEVPEIPPFEFHFDMPDMQFYKSMPYEYHFNMPPIPAVPQAPDFYHEKKHRHDDLWHSLPFYDWFKS